jgi:FkbM family methyltransferase
VSPFEKEEHPSGKISKIINRFLNPEGIYSIWDIGSRDGNDSIEIVKNFPSAKVFAFEPNPQTYPMVKKNSDESEGVIQSFNVALSNIDGPITFFQIDTEKTESTWSDGNPGASSIFQTSGKYPIEQYVQNSILVESRRGDSLIESGVCEVPNLIWMDVQGAEQLVLEGFGAKLKEIDFIYIELSLNEIYTGQALAREVTKYLTKHFYWHSNLNIGKWQFDAIFVNKKYRRIGIFIRHTVLITSLFSGLGWGIRYSGKSLRQNVRRRIRQNVRWGTKFCWNRIRNLFRRSENILFGSVLVHLSISITELFEKKRLNFRLRELVSLSQPSEPLKNSSALPIELVIPCHSKDIENLPRVISFAQNSIKNPITAIKLICPASLKNEITLLHPECEVYSDDELLSPEIVKVISNGVPLNRQGWVRQQVIKFAAVIRSSTAASLILDADTLLLKKRNWIDSNAVQLLAIASEFHEPYKHHYKNFFGGPTLPISFVTHHQLMQKAFVQEMFGVDGIRLADWIKAADFSQASALSEYDTYGEWALANKSNRVRYTKWNNLPVRRDEIRGLTNSEIQAKFNLLGSISVHSYL